MAEVEELKKLRSVSKRKLTIVLNKLKSSLQYGDPEFKTHYLSSVTEYENLVDIKYFHQSQRDTYTARSVQREPPQTSA